MNRLFVRTYLALAGVVVVALALLFAWDAALRRPLGAWMEAATTSPRVVRQSFAEEADPERAVARAAAELDAVVEVVPPDRLPPPVRGRIADGLPVFPAPGGPPDLWVPLDDGRIVRVRPRLPSPPPVGLLAAGVLLGLGAAVAWQLRPLDRQLERLADAARAFGDGDLDVRVRLPPTSPVGELGARFDAMADRIGALVRAREHLLAAVSHELRTPLQRLRFATELLAGSSEGDRERLAEGVQRDLDALDALVGELLAWTRLDAGPAVAAEIFDLHPLLQAAAADHARLGTAIDVDCPEIRVQADRRLLQRAVGNLLANAVRYGNGRVLLAATADDTGVVLRVDDDGPGIPPADRARVVDPFVRLDDARSRDEGGVGLGLALVDRIARAHRGKLSIGDSPLGGASVSIWLPPAAPG